MAKLTKMQLTLCLQKILFLCNIQDVLPIPLVHFTTLYRHVDNVPEKEAQKVA